MVKLDIDKNKYDIKDRTAFESFIKASFVMRRKKLSNNLEKICSLSKAQLEEKLEQLGFNKDLRAESLTTSQFITIYNYLFENKYFKNL